MHKRSLRLLPLPLAGEGWGEGLQRLPDLLKHSRCFVHHFVVPEPDNAKTLAFDQCGSTLVVALLVAVLPAVDFNNQPGFETHEVKDVRTQGALPAELESLEAAASYVLPQQGFGFSGGGAQFSRFLFGLRPHPNPLPQAGEGVSHVNL